MRSDFSIGTARSHAVNGVDLNVVEAGVGDPAMVLLPFWGGSARTWAPLIEQLATTNRCIAIDYRGWGESSKAATDYGIGTLASDVSAILAELKLREFILIGHSMGGKVAQLVAAEHPAGLRRLILIAPAPPTPIQVSQEQRDGMVASYQSREGVLEIISALPLPADRRELIIAEILKGAPGAKRAWPEQGMAADITRQAETITAPVHIIVGGADVVEPLDGLREAFGEVLPHTGFTVLPGVSHMAPLEATAAVAAAIRSAELR